jgi:hypothetical protein
MDESIDVDARRPVVLFTDHDASFAKTREPDRQMTLRGARFRVRDQKFVALSRYRRSASEPSTTTPRVCFVTYASAPRVPSGETSSFPPGSPSDGLPTP